MLILHLAEHCTLERLAVCSLNWDLMRLSHAGISNAITVPVIPGLLIVGVIHVLALSMILAKGFKLVVGYFDAIGFFLLSVNFVFQLQNFGKFKFLPRANIHFVLIIIEKLNKVNYFRG